MNNFTYYAIYGNTGQGGQRDGQTHKAKPIHPRYAGCNNGSQVHLTAVF